MTIFSWQLQVPPHTPPVPSSIASPSTTSAASPLKPPAPSVGSPMDSTTGTKVKNTRQSPDSGVAINSSTHSSFSSSRESSSLSPHATGAEDSQDTPAIGSVGTSASSPQKRSKSLSDYTGDIRSSPSATLSSTFSFSMNSQVNTTSGAGGMYSSSSSGIPQRQRLYSAPNIKGMQPLSHAPTMMSTKHSPTMNHFSLPRGYGQMTQPPPYGHYQGYTTTGYGSYATAAAAAAAGASYQPQTPFSPTYNNYSTGTVAGTPYLVHPGPPGSTLYSVNAARPPSYPPTQQNMSSSYFPYSTTAVAASNNATSVGLLPSSTGAMTTQQSANYNSTTTGYPTTGYNGTTSSVAGNNGTMFSQPSTATTMTGGGASLNAISEGQSVLASVSMPTAITTSAVGDINSLDLSTTLTTTGDLDTSHESATSDSSFPVVSLPSSVPQHQHQTSLSTELDSQNLNAANDANRETHSEVPVILSVESHAQATNDSSTAKTTTTAQQVNGSNSDKEQVYTKR